MSDRGVSIENVAAWNRLASRRPKPKPWRQRLQVALERRPPVEPEFQQLDLFEEGADD